ncbi:MAG: hypothetical protein IT519_07500 [Burkholderiales bacterium]|nr:hypothetical protein [Burkholderiales bacterium]
MAAGRDTLLFCTSYCRSEGEWRGRPRRWLDHHLPLPIDRRAVFVLDDASPWVPDDADVRVIDALPDELPAGPAAFLFRFATHEGRHGMFGHRGWWRSFLHSLDIARALGCTRIVHVESDAFLLSRRLVEHINGIDRGWTAFWCPHYNVPEAGLQVIAEDSFGAMEEVASRGIDTLTRALAEVTLPFTHVERGFAGNRYGERGRRIPGYADYACQVNYATMATHYRG